MAPSLSRAISATYTNPAGATYAYRRSQDRTSVHRTLAGGIELDFAHAVDERDGFEWMKSASARMPSGKRLAIGRALGRVDADGDNAFETQVDTVTVNGRPWVRTQDTAAGAITQRSPSGRTVSATYDPATLLTSRTSVPGLLPVEYAYDARGRITSMTQGERSASLSYDASGNVASVRAPDGKTTSFTYDAMGRPTAQRRPDGSELRLAYDANGNVTAITVPSGVTHDLTYTAGDQRRGWTTPLSSSYAYTYDGERNLKSITLPSGASIDYGYTQGFLTSITTPEGVTELIRGRCGRLNAAVRASEVASYTYDGWLVSSDTRKGTVDQRITYAYDDDLRPTAIRYAGATETVAYDADGLMVRSGPFAIARDEANGLPVSVASSDTVWSRTFSGYGELSGTTVSARGSAAFSWSVTRDSAGRIATKQETTQGGFTVYSYTYDEMGRLASVTSDGAPAESYAYDAQGNRTAETVTARGSIRASSYDEEDRILTAGADTYAFSEDGFLTSKHTPEGATTYDYGPTGELRGARLPSGVRIAHTYDAFGRRIARSVDGAVTDTYLWADATRLLAVFGPTGAMKYRFSYADDRVPLAVATPDTTYTLAFDQTGSLRAVIASDGAVAKEVVYDSFGDVLSDTNPALDIPLGFAGGLSDPLTGLVRFGVRDYDPATGRWTAKDPIDFAAGDPNLYGYCLSDPVNWVDPDGLKTRRDGGSSACPQDCQDPWDTMDPWARGATFFVIGESVVAAGSSIGVGVELSKYGIALIASGGGVLGGLIVTGLGFGFVAFGGAILYGDYLILMQVMPCRLTGKRPLFS